MSIEQNFVTFLTDLLLSYSYHFSHFVIVTLFVEQNAILCINEQWMNEGVFATILFDLALFGTSNPIINGIISFFTTIQNSWDAPFKNGREAEEKIRDFCNRLDIQQNPWIWEKQPRDYSSLNDFFSRTYASDSFPSIGNGRLVSPACCKILTFHDDSCMKSILIKGCNYQLEKVGFPSSDLEAYRKNRVFLGYLSPKDYHRVHAPISVRKHSS